MSRDEAGKLGLKIGILFWLTIVMVAVNIVTTYIIKSENANQMFSDIASIVYGLVLVTMGSACKRYEKAGFVYLISAAGSIAVSFIIGIGILEDSLATMSLSLVLTVVLAIVGLYSEFCEYSGHIEIVKATNSKLAERWRTLWAWNVVGYVLLGFSFIFTLASLGSFLMAMGGAGNFSLILLTIGGLIIIVVEIVKLIYLHKTEVLLKERAGAMASGFDASSTNTSYVYTEPAEEPGDSDKED